MAVFNVPNYKDADGLGFPLNFRRGNPNPLDNSSVWASLDAAKTYASTDPTAYVGQVLSVVNEADGYVDVYKIQNVAGDLEMVGTVTLGDGVTIIKNNDDTLSIMGFDEAEAGAQPRKTAEGTIEWVKPDTTTVDGLSTAVKGLETDVDTLRSDVDANTAAIEVLNGDSATEGSVAYQIAAVVAGADADFDTLKEIADWIAAHPDSVATINAAIKENTDAIDALEALVGTDSVDTQIANAIAEALQAEGVDKYALATDLSDAVARIAANETDIDSLQALVGESSVADQIKAAVKETVDGAEVDKFALRAHSHTVSDITGLGAQLDTLATKDTVNGIDSRVEALENGLGTTIDAAIQEHVAAADAKYETIENVSLLSGQVDAKVAALEKTDTDNLSAAKTYTEEQIAALKISEYAKQVDLDNATAAINAIKDHDTVDSFADVMVEIAKKQDVIPENTYDTYGAASAVDTKLESYKTEANGRLDALEAVDNATQTELNEAVEALEAADAAILAKIGDVAEGETVVGLIGAAQTAADNAQAAADAAQGEVDALEIYVGTIPADYTETNIVAYINKKAEETLNAASGGSSESAASVLAALNTYKTENDPKVAANTAAAAAAQTTADEAKATAEAAYVKPADGISTDDLHANVVASLGKADTALQAADIESKADKATTLAGYGITDAYTKTEVDGLVGAKVDQTDYDTKVAALEAKDTELAGLISDNADAIADEQSRAEGVEAGLDARLVEVETFFKTAEGETLDAALDTLVEIQKYISEDGTAADQMVLDIAANTKAIEDMDAAYKAADTTLQGNIDALAETVETKAAASDLDALTTRVGTLETNSATKDELAAVSEVAEAAVTVAEMNAAIAAAGHAAQTDLEALQTKHDEYEAAHASDYTNAQIDAAIDADVKVVGDALDAHKADTVAHITADERTAWNGAVSDLAAHKTAYDVKIAELVAEDADIRVDFAAADATLQSNIDSVDAAYKAADEAINTEVAKKANSDDVYTKEQVEAMLSWGSF